MKRTLLTGRISFLNLKRRMARANVHGGRSPLPTPHKSSLWGVGIICGVSLLALGACSKKTTETKSEMTVTQTVTTGEKAANNLKEGLWNISMTNDKMPMTMKATVCVGKDGIADIEKASKADISPDCDTPKIDRAAGKITSSVTCKKDGKTTDVQSELTFSSDESFEQKMSVKLQGGASGDTAFNQTIAGTYKGACPEGMKVGDVKMNLGG